MILFCYLNQLLIFVPCMIISEQRIAASRHCLTCLPTKSRATFSKEERSSLTIMCCSGEPIEDRKVNVNFLEVYPVKLFKCLTGHPVCKIAVLLLFLAYIGLSIWGASKLNIGMDLSDLVTKDSHFYRYNEVNDQWFTKEAFITLYFKTSNNYSDDSKQIYLQNLIHSIKSDSDINSKYSVCWYCDYKTTTYYNDTSEESFAKGLKQFLKYNRHMQHDVLFNEEKTTIGSSRFFFVTKHLPNFQSYARLMTRLRTLADESHLPVTVFSAVFPFLEHFNSILAATLQTLGCAVAALLLMSVIFMPHPIVIGLMTLSMFSILLGILGFMHFWDLSLSSITMLELIICVGFSVDASAHVCHAYMTSEGKTRQTRINRAFDCVGGPIFNASMSSLIAVLTLAFSKSFIFQSFFKLMVLVISFGLLHAILLMPVLLAYFGPEVNNHSNSKNNAGRDSTSSFHITGINKTTSFTDLSKAGKGIHVLY